MNSSIEESVKFFQNQINRMAMNDKVSKTHLYNFTKHVNVFINHFNNDEIIISELEMKIFGIELELEKTKPVYEFWKEQQKTGVWFVVVCLNHLKGFLLLSDMFRGYKERFDVKKNEVVKDYKIIQEIC